MENNNKILIVDDEAHIRRVLEVKLKNRGYQVFMGKNGEEGFEIIQKEKPVAVVLDINMPIMDGKTLCTLTNPIKQNRPFLTIIVTARINPYEQEWLDDMQDTILMEKPFSPSKILGVIKEYIGGQR